MSKFLHRINRLKILCTPAALLGVCLVMSDFGRAISDSRPPANARGAEVGAANGSPLIPVAGWLTSGADQRPRGLLESGRAALFRELDSWRTNSVGINTTGWPACAPTGPAMLRLSPDEAGQIYQGKYLSITSKFGAS